MKKGYYKGDNYFLNVSMKSGDTLNFTNEVERGEVKFSYRLNDSIKRVNEDEREIALILGIKNHKENQGAFLKGRNFIDTILPIQMDKDTFKFSFKFKPHFKGKAYVFGFLTDFYYLKSYHKDSTRMLSWEYFLEKDVYIK
ncbi:hypothetical protein [Tenacibaculum sp. MAR_2009_124]|uniref:hypothetical protein n=1 Tax=Tenacibaculum sp. MAR_2009_124 TaxID=1250059 RepID=UPI00115F9AC7|nr:hypothetical protein [Tenacibaculum sp. MAR_2009_124]